MTIPARCPSCLDDSRIASAKKKPGAAALAYVALARTPAADFFAWQPVLVPALELGVLAPGEGTAGVVEQLLGGRPTDDAVRARLQFVATYADDAHWSADVAAPSASQA